MFGVYDPEWTSRGYYRSGEQLATTTPHVRGVLDEGKGWLERNSTHVLPLDTLICSEDFFEHGVFLDFDLIQFP